MTEQEKQLFHSILTDYESARHRMNALDFDDMVYECRNLLRDNRRVREELSRRYTHILVDEFQDINPMQYETLKYLAGEGKRVFAVGDDDQAIYGFRGSSPACLKMFVKDFRSQQILLQVNYRSTQQIIEAATRVIGENRERIAKEMQKSSAGTGEIGREVQLKSFENREQEYRYLIRRLEENKSEECAVLFRTNAYMQGFAARLDREGISYVMKEKGTGIYEHFIAGDIMAYLLIASGKGTREMWLRIMNKPYRNLDRELFAEEGVAIMSPVERDNLQKLKQQLKQVSEMRPGIAVRFICKGMGYEKYLQKRAGKDSEKWQEWAWICDWLIEEASCYSSVEEWLKAQKEGEKQRRPEDEKNRLHLMTAHAAKGLEFENVWIPDCNEKIFPHGNMPDENTCEEERRLLYVAMTRAKKSLELLYLTGTGERPRLPSRFLNPLFTHLQVHQTRNCPDTHQTHLPPFHILHRPR